ncbi:hypothetical protein ACOMHN_021725 [Nucella lapillus]
MSHQRLCYQVQSKTRVLHKPPLPTSITCGICRHKFTSTSTCCDHMKVHSRTRSANSSSTHPKTSSEVMSASPVPHFSPPGSPLPKRPQTALASAFRKYPTSLKPLKRSMSEPPSAEKGKLISPSLGHGDVLA